MLNDLVKIKKYYGESMMHLCRSLFPTILEQDGLLLTLLDSCFNRSKTLYNDIVENNLVDKFKNFIYSLISFETNQIIVNKTAKELLKIAGYTLYECTNEEDIKKFKKYYTEDEELCTFRDNRLKNDYVFFAIKDGAEKLNRNDFEHPEREDEYGVSVISIQFSKGEINTLSIKNRYNHTVLNADATFENNLENIIPGLTNSFAKDYHLNISSNDSSLGIPSYRRASDGRFYKYNYEINNILYCTNNIIIDNGNIIDKYKDKSRYLFVDYFIFDMQKKEIFCYDKTLDDGFLKSFPSTNFSKLTIKKEENYKLITIYFDDKTYLIKLDKLGRIIYLENKYVTNIEDNFLEYNEVLTDIDIENVINIGNSFLYHNSCLKSFKHENLESIGDYFLYYNKNLEEFICNSVKTIGSCFLHNNIHMNKISANNVQKIGDMCLVYNRDLTSLYLPNIIEIGHNFFENNTILNDLNLPLLKIIGDSFMINNNSLLTINLENVEEIGYAFFKNNNSIKFANFPNLRKVGNLFFVNNKCLEYLYVAMLEIVGCQFLFANENLKYAYFPNLKIASSEFMYNNKILKEFSAPKLEIAGNDFMYWNCGLEYLYLESLKKIGKNSFQINEKLEIFSAPRLLYMGDLSFRFNNRLKYIEVGENCHFGYYCFDMHEDKNIMSELKSNRIWSDRQKVKALA